MGSLGREEQSSVTPAGLTGKQQSPRRGKKEQFVNRKLGRRSGFLPAGSRGVLVILTENSDLVSEGGSIGVVIVL